MVLLVGLMHVYSSHILVLHSINKQFAGQAFDFVPHTPWGFAAFLSSDNLVQAIDNFIHTISYDLIDPHKKQDD